MSRKLAATNILLANRACHSLHSIEQVRRTDMKRLLLGAIAGITCLSGCQTADPGASNSDRDASTRGRSAMETVAGNWTFSRLGASPVSEGAEEILKVGKENLTGARISIEADGKASMLVAGRSGSITLEVLEETPIYIKLGAVEVEDQAPLTYDRSTRLLALPINLEIGGEVKILPAYFKRKSLRR